MVFSLFYSLIVVVDVVEMEASSSVALHALSSIKKEK